MAEGQLTGERSRDVQEDSLHHGHIGALACTPVRDHQVVHLKLMGILFYVNHNRLNKALACNVS